MRLKVVVVVVFVVVVGFFFMVKKRRYDDLSSLFSRTSIFQGTFYGTPCINKLSK